MTILPKQKAAGPAPKKSVVNRDGNHSRDVAHDRQGVPGASAADRGWGPSGHGSASSSAWPSGVGPPAPGPSSSRGWGTAAVPGTSGSLVGHPGAQQLNLASNLVDPLASVGGSPDGHRSPVGLDDRHTRGLGLPKKRPAPSSVQTVSHSDGFPFANPFSHQHSDRLEVSLREEREDVCTPHSPHFNGPSSGPKRGRLQNMTVVRASREASAANTVGAAVAAQAVNRGGTHNQSDAVGPPTPPQALANVATARADDADVEGGYNSEDEYSHIGVQLTEEEWQGKDRRFERLMKKKGFVIKKMQEDGSCLFRAVADQIYGDEEMHCSVRRHCMDYIEQNSDYFSQYVTEEISDYVERKRFVGVHGNHLEIQALSEMYNRPIHIHCYSAEPINIFQAMGDASNNANAKMVPIRLCYHRGCHYNSLVDPHTATIGVGLGLPNHNPGAADRNLVGQAVKQSEQDVVEKTMLEDKIRATDWEATNEAIEEQVARESYLQWLRDNERRNTGSVGIQKQRSIDNKSLNSCNQSSATSTSSSGSPATVTSGELRRGLNLASADNVPGGGSGSPARSPKPSSSSEPGVKQIGQQTISGQKLLQVASNSPKAGCSSERDSPKPSGSSSSQQHQLQSSRGSGFQLLETATFLNGLPPNLFGLEDWSDADVLTQVLAASQQEYLDSLKHQQSPDNSSNGNRRVDNQYYSQRQIESPTKCKGEGNISTNASSPPKSRHKNGNNNNTIKQPFDPYSPQEQQRPMTTPVPIVSAIQVERRVERSNNNKSQTEYNNVVSNVPPAHPTPSLSASSCIIPSSEQTKDNTVSSESSRNPSSITEECDKSQSRTRSPASDSS